MPVDDVEKCACGKSLHYIDRDKRAQVDDLVARLGPNVPVTVGRVVDQATGQVTDPGRTWEVPRHYIALHGLAAEELPALAAKYKFKEVLPKPVT